MKNLMQIIQGIYQRNKPLSKEDKLSKPIEEYLTNEREIIRFLRSYEKQRIRGILTLDKDFRYGQRVFEGYLEDIADYVDRETNREVKGSISTYEWVRAIHQKTTESQKENHILRLIGMYWPNIQEEASQFSLGDIKYTLKMDGVD